ncbi:MAG: hypothetical protein Q8L81_01450 [Bacteroidota bacterium]|nr:hypothetical protein [Bacteroidota bacterium]
MKKIILLIIFPFIGFTQNNTLEGQNGFKNYVFGTSPNELKNLTLEIDEDNTKLYSLPEDNIKIEGVEFEYIRVTFSKNKLSTISVQTKNATGPKFLEVLKENYGEPKLNAARKSFEWASSNMLVIYEKNNSGKDASISFYGKKILESKR